MAKTALYIVNLINKPFTLDLSFDDDRILRDQIPAHGKLDVSGIATLDELNRHAGLQKLRQAKKLDIDVGEPGDDEIIDDQQITRELKSERREVLVSGTTNDWQRPLTMYTLDLSKCNVCWMRATITWHSALHGETGVISFIVGASLEPGGVRISTPVYQADQTPNNEDAYFEIGPGDNDLSLKVANPTGTDHQIDWIATIEYQEAIK